MDYTPGYCGLNPSIFKEMVANIIGFSTSKSLRVDAQTIGSLVTLFNCYLREVVPSIGRNVEKNKIMCIGYACHSIISNMIEDVSRPDSSYRLELPADVSYTDFQEAKNNILRIMKGGVLFRSVVWYIASSDLSHIDYQIEESMFDLALLIMISPIFYTESAKSLAEGIMSYVITGVCNGLLTSKIDYIAKNLLLSGIRKSRRLEVIIDHFVTQEEYQLTLFSQLVERIYIPLPITNNMQLSELFVQNRLGEGSYGAVFSAIFREKQYAIKKQSTELERAIAEIAFLKQFKHANIIAIEDFFIQPKQVVMVLEYAGKNLDDYITQNLEYDKRKCIKNVLSGLSYLHDQANIIHCDIKPANILINDNGEAKIIDFGLSVGMTIPRRDVKFRNFRGTPVYASPNVITDIIDGIEQSSYGFKMDVYAFGIVIVEIETGFHPFFREGDDLESMLENIDYNLGIYPNYREKSIIPDSPFSALTVNMLRYSEAKRFTAAQCLQMLN